MFPSPSQRDQCLFSKLMVFWEKENTHILKGLLKKNPQLILEA